MRIYVLCYDDDSERRAHVDFDGYSWAFVYRIPHESQRDSLYENVMYTDLLAAMQHEWEWTSYVGLLSYKAKTKCRMDLVLDAIANAKSDCVFFKCQSLDVYKSGASHPDFADAWNALVVKALGIQGQETALCNFWMCRPSIMKEFIQYFRDQVWPAVERIPSMWTDSLYATKIPRLNRRLPYVPNVPFVLERLPLNWALHRNYSVTQVYDTASPIVNRWFQYLGS